jgi:hypothetical protein
MVTRMHPPTWKGSGLQYAQAMANNSFSRTPGVLFSTEEFRRVVNLNHFGPHVPAAAYYEQSDCFWWDMRRNGDPCATITEGRYFPDLVIPDKLKSLNPDWKSCSVVIGAQDPPVLLSVTSKLVVPTLHPIANPEQTVGPTVAQEGGRPVPEPMPTATGTFHAGGNSWVELVSTSIVLGTATVGIVYNPGARQTTAAAQQASGVTQQAPAGAHQPGAYPEDQVGARIGAQIGAQPVGSQQADDPGAQQVGIQNMKTGLPGVQNPAAEGQGARYPSSQNSGGTQPDARANVVIGSQTLFMNGPAQTLAGQVVSLGPQGLLIGDASLGGGTKTIPLPQMSQGGGYVGEPSARSTVQDLVSGEESVVSIANWESSSRVGTAAVPRSSTRKNSAVSSHGVEEVLFRIYTFGVGWCFVTCVSFFSTIWL